MEALESIWRPWGDYGHILAKLQVVGLQLAVCWGVLGGPWAGLELMFEPVGVISGCLGHQNVVQGAPGCGFTGRDRNLRVGSDGDRAVKNDRRF